MTAGEYITFTGLILTALTTAFGWFWQRWQERKSVRIAIVAEVLALREIATGRSYHAGLIEKAEHLESIPEEHRTPIGLSVAIPSHYCRVYLANIGKLGYLSLVDAQLVVMFYQYTDSVVQDVLPGGVIFDGTKNPIAFREAARILEFALDVAEKLAHRHGAK